MTREEFDAAFEGLHIYPQALWHDDAYVCGTRAGIEKLRDALTSAFAAKDGTAMAEDIFATDGEGYQVRIHVLPYPEMMRLACPYTDEVARDHVDSFWPWHLAVKAKHSRMTTTQGHDQ